jgi:hypothetical protein
VLAVIPIGNASADKYKQRNGQKFGKPQPTNVNSPARFVENMLTQRGCLQHHAHVEGKTASQHSAHICVAQHIKRSKLSAFGLIAHSWITLTKQRWLKRIELWGLYGVDS